MEWCAMSYPAGLYYAVLCCTRAIYCTVHNEQSCFYSMFFFKVSYFEGSFSFTFWGAAISTSVALTVPWVYVQMYICTMCLLIMLSVDISIHKPKSNLSHKPWSLNGPHNVVKHND